jgi:hypothetical protein
VQPVAPLEETKVDPIAETKVAPVTETKAPAEAVVPAEDAKSVVPGKSDEKKAEA